ncbi:hypothetical protein KIF59_23920 [Enterobacter cloacae subsp. cloacae]|nr:hypothetical protein [Enterobacter cloacae subsp. cloacae]
MSCALPCLSSTVDAGRGVSASRAKFTCIGQIMPESEGLKFVKDGAPVTLDWKGYDHFG